MKILNLYARIGGNRKLWGDQDEITAVEIDPKIARIYKDFFPKDKMIIGDAHEYLLKHFEEYDFIWSSPPCPTHSSFAKLRAKSDDFGRGNYCYKPKYPDMKLYEEIILLQHLFNGKFCIENVIGYYEPLIKPEKIQRHYFWANFLINPIKIESDNIKKGKIKEWQEKIGFDISKYKIEKRLVLRNCINPKLGLHIFQCAFTKNRQGTIL